MNIRFAIFRFFSSGLAALLLGTVLNGTAWAQTVFSQDDHKQSASLLPQISNRLLEIPENDLEDVEFEEGDVAENDIQLVTHTVKRRTISIRYHRWWDASRRRTIPAKVFLPDRSFEEPCPLILFSHGLGGSYQRCSYLGTSWASRGFVVVLVQHPGSDDNVWRGKVRILSELQESFQRNWSGRTRARDLRFVLDHLEQLRDEGHESASRIDFRRIGVGGYDLGALASLLLAGQVPPDGGPSLEDPRITAVLAMSPPVHRPRKNYRDDYGPIKVPAMMITGTEDDGIVGQTKAHQRRIPFDFMSQNDRFLITLRGGDHMVYGGHILSVRASNDRYFQAAIIRSSSCFWLANLRDDPASQATLESFGLNRLLGNRVFVERRISQTLEADSSTPTEFENNSDDQMEDSRLETKSGSNLGLKTADPGFPISRLYREILEQFEEKSLATQDAGRNHLSLPVPSQGRRY